MKQNLPGRLGNCDLTLNEDKRINQSLLQAMIKIGLDGVPPAPPVNNESTKEEIQDYTDDSEPLYQGVFSDIFSSVELPKGLLNSGARLSWSSNLVM